MLARKVLTIAALLPLTIHAAATIQVLNDDGAGEGFNDPTPATPVGGNVGTTVGEQRQRAFQHAASIWGAKLTSNQVIKVIASFDDLPCTATTAVLGGAAPYWSFRGFAPAPGFPGLIPDTWYPAALAEKRTGKDITGSFAPSESYEFWAQFNRKVGQAGCLTGRNWYYGFDGKVPPADVDLLAVLLHEFGHGLGFTIGLTDDETGGRYQNYPTIWERFMLDLTAGKTWLDMSTSTERAQSVRNTNNLVWSGPQVLIDAPAVLAFQTELVIDGPASARGTYEATAHPFGPPPTISGVRELLIPAYDSGGVSPTDGCEPISLQTALKGRIALIDSGNCSSTVKVKNVQVAGAIGAVIANDRPAGVTLMRGADPSITIPSIGVSQGLGAQLRTLANFGAGGRAGVPVRLRLNPYIRAGTTNGYPRLYAPNPYEVGSSGSHWDFTVFPNQLMEPYSTPALAYSVEPPQDLTLSLLRDIGW